MYLQSVWLYVQRQRTGVEKICSKYKKPVWLVLHEVHWKRGWAGTRWFFFFFNLESFCQWSSSRLFLSSFSFILRKQFQRGKLLTCLTEVLRDFTGTQILLTHSKLKTGHLVKSLSCNILDTRVIICKCSQAAKHQNKLRMNNIYKGSWYLWGKDMKGQLCLICHVS